MRACARGVGGRCRPGRPVGSVFLRGGEESEKQGWGWRAERGRVGGAAPDLPSPRPPVCPPPCRAFSPPGGDAGVAARRATPARHHAPPARVSATVVVLSRRVSLPPDFPRHVVPRGLGPRVPGVGWGAEPPPPRRLRLRRRSRPTVRDRPRTGGAPGASRDGWRGRGAARRGGGGSPWGAPRPRARPPARRLSAAGPGPVVPPRRSSVLRSGPSAPSPGASACPPSPGPLLRRPSVCPSVRLLSLALSLSRPPPPRARPARSPPPPRLPLKPP